MVIWRQQIDDGQDEPSSHSMDEITGIAGRLRQHNRQAANDLAAMLLILVFVFAWNCAKNRANFGGNFQNRAKYLQNNAMAFLTQGFAETRAIQRLYETRRLFLEPDTPCQMNSPLTLCH